MPLQPGIYFNLPDEVYHADPALSRGNIVALLDTPRTYWENSWMNPERKKLSNKAMEYGKAFHYLLFEPELFEKLYQVVPVDPWKDGAIKIMADDYYAMVESIKVLRAGKNSSMFLTGGYSEVTIVFDDQNREGHKVRFRTRHDYMTPICTPDAKTTDLLDEWHLKREFERRGLDVQMALYRRSRIRFKEQFTAGEAHVYGEVNAKFFEMFMQQEMDEFINIFQRKTKPYPFEILMPDEGTEQSGFSKIWKAVDIHRKYTKQHGNSPWPVSEGRVREFSMFYGIKEEN